jgi:hypothetical protein
MSFFIREALCKHRQEEVKLHVVTAKHFFTSLFQDDSRSHSKGTQRPRSSINLFYFDISQYVKVDYLRYYEEYTLWPT